MARRWSCHASVRNITIEMVNLSYCRVNLVDERRIDHMGKVGAPTYQFLNRTMICGALFCFVLGMHRTSGSDYPRLEVDAFSQSRFTTTATNGKMSSNISNATLMAANSTNINDTFCILPNDTTWFTPYHSCKTESETWKALSSLFSEFDNLGTNVTTNNPANYTPNNLAEELVGWTPERAEWTGECGSQCRPSCITLLLDLDRLRTDHFLCPKGESCVKPCSHVPRSTCHSDATDALYQQYPKCFLEDAHCYGPTIYEDIAAVYESRWSNQSLPTLDHCTSIPNDDFYQRFHGWQVVSPMILHNDCRNNITTHSCFNRSSKIFFEYCNVAEEDYDTCRTCRATNDCTTTQCPKIIQPFPDGWTTFVVSASIPYPEEDTSCRLPTNATTGAACFLQQIQFFYPGSCPHCHTCPPIGLGDTFGPLEVVGFGHAIQQECAPCHRPSLLTNRSQLSCPQLQRCHELVECTTGTSMGLPSFVENQCSFQAVVVGEDSMKPDDDFVPNTGSPTVAPTPITMAPSIIPNVTVDQNDTWVDNQTTTSDDETSDIITDTASNHRLSPLVVAFIVMGLVVVITVQWLLYHHGRSVAPHPPRRVAEEIVYIEPLEFDGLDKMLSSGASQNTADEEPTDDSDTEPPPKWRRAWNVTEELPQEIRHFQTASILERADQNEVEALYMTGKHHIQLPP